jgi:hypothetical protein
VFANRRLRQLFMPQKQKIRRNWINSYNWKLCYPTLHQIHYHGNEVEEDEIHRRGRKGKQHHVTLLLKKLNDW